MAHGGDAPGTAPGRRRQALRSTALAGGFHLQPCVQPYLVGLIVGQVLALAIGARAVDTPSLDGLLIAVLRFLALVRVDLFEVVMQRALCVGSGGTGGARRGSLHIGRLQRRLGRARRCARRGRCSTQVLRVHEFGTGRRRIAVLHVPLRIDRTVDVARGGGQRHQVGERGGAAYQDPSPAEPLVSALILRREVKSVTFDGSPKANPGRLAGPAGVGAVRARSPLGRGPLEGYSSASPCWERSRPSRSSSTVTRRPMVRSTSLRVIMLMMNP